MTYHAILIASIFLLLAFAIERIGRASGLPTVIAMVGLGLVAHPLLGSLQYTLKGLDIVVPIIGTIGLVLIVLEGALDIELKKDRLKMAKGAIAMSVFGLVSCVGIFGSIAVWLLGLSWFQAALITLPFAMISSAIAIPSCHFLPPHGREFVVYESSISDILGVLVFFALLNSDGTLGNIVQKLLGGGALSLLLAVICSVGLVLVLMRIEGHIRFIPLLAGLFGLYAVGELLHLSPLIMVLFFGLALNNPSLITRIRPLRGWTDKKYRPTLNEFKVLVKELTFAVRGFFFILLGYWTDLSDLASLHAWLAAILILGVVYLGRHLALKALQVDLASALTWIAPRGLITVLLYFSARKALDMPSFMSGTVVLVVLISAALVAIAQRIHVANEAGEKPKPVGPETSSEGSAPV